MVPEHEGLLPHSREFAIGLYPEPAGLCNMILDIYTFSPAIAQHCSSLFGCSWASNIGSIPVRKSPREKLTFTLAQHHQQKLDLFILQPADWNPKQVSFTASSMNLQLHENQFCHQKNIMLLRILRTRVWSMSSYRFIQKSMLFNSIQNCIHTHSSNQYLRWRCTQLHSYVYYFIGSCWYHLTISHAALTGSQDWVLCVTMPGNPLQNKKSGHWKKFWTFEEKLERSAVVWGSGTCN
jgi:hypothetical protein